MAPRKCKIDKKDMVENDVYDEEENSASFQDEVELELAFMQQFSVADFDNTARKEAEKEREIVYKKLRESIRFYDGPPLETESAKEKERIRLYEIQKEFNRASARRSKVRKMAKTRYLYWANIELEKMLEKSKKESNIENFYRTHYQKTVADAEENYKVLKNHVNGKTGNGNGY
jgi:hypothetical protein